jgi:YfiH family protein
VSSGPVAFDRDGWDVVDGAGPRFLRSASLARVPGVAHAFSTRRHADGGEFDVGGPGEDGRAGRARLELARAAGLGPVAPVVLRQVHGSEIVRAGSDGVEADGVVSIRGSDTVPAAVRTADCVPILMADVAGAAVAAVHAGWRGTASAIATRAVERLAGHGAAPRDLVVALGPAIGPCCYEVGAEVVDAVARGSGLPASVVSRGGRTLDLHAALRGQLVAAGVPAGSIASAPWCTACDRDLFWSWRRDGGRTGRHMSCIGFVPSS